MWIFRHRGHGTRRRPGRPRHVQRLRVRPHPLAAGPRVALVLDDGEPLVLTPLEVGRLRWRLRDAMLDASEQCARLAEQAGGSA